MRRLKLSYLLILLALGLVLSQPNLHASENQNVLQKTPESQLNKIPVQKPAPTRQVSKRNQHGTKDDPIFVEVIKPAKTDEESTQEEKEREEKLALDRRTLALNEKTADLSVDTNRFNGYLALFAGLQLAVLLVQLRILWLQASYNRTQTTNQQVIERAYVKMSHKPPGMIFPVDEESPIKLGYVEMQIKNFGRTPARVTDVVITMIHTELDAPISAPLTDSASRKQPFQAFLVENEEVFHAHPQFFDADIMVQIRFGSRRLYVFGYIDYIDQFGERHRAGYARAYIAGKDFKGIYSPPEAFDTRNNLDLLTEPGYNYDRPREPGEGHDWDEPI